MSEPENRADEPALVKLRDVLGKCNACAGSRIMQMNTDPVRLDHCTRCDGEGYDRVIQFIMHTTGLMAMTANGLLLHRKPVNRRPHEQPEYTWKVMD